MSVRVVRVPGAALHCAVRGSGPALLVLQGGAGDADTGAAFVDRLAARYTVVTYDRRGQARSPLDDPAEELRVATEGDDARCVLLACADGPAHVFGSSLGAVIALDLAARHPDRLGTVVAHEPPAPYLLGETAPALGDLREALRQEGAAAALRRFAAAVGVQPQAGASPVPEPRSEANGRFFIEREAGMLRDHRLDLAALRAAPCRVVLAGGETGREHWPYRSASAVAERLGAPLVELPGDHAGYVTHPLEFADRLHEVLSDGR